MKIKGWIFFLSVFSASPALATITIQAADIGGVSNKVVDSTGTEIIAGLNGTDATTCSSTSGLCNTCTTSVGTCTVTSAGTSGCCGGYTCYSCNEKAVTDSTVLSIRFTSDSVSSGTPVLKATTPSSYSITSTSGAQSGGTFTFTSTWDEVCKAVSGCNNCAAIIANSSGSCRDSSLTSNELTLEVTSGTSTDTATLKFKVYYQPNATSGTVASPNAGSFTDFSTYPGDEKVYIDPNSSGNFPNSSMGLIKSIHFFIGTGSFQTAYFFKGSGATTGDVFTPATQSVYEDGSMDQVIDGLENNVIYHFRPASIDEAGNIFSVMDDLYLKTQGCDPTVEGGGTSCPYARAPSEVTGLLTEDLNCFVATAAYGSSLDPHIQTFREFRFKVLLPSHWGQQLNYAYYNYGPKLAHLIHSREWAKTVSRAFLWPLWGWAKLSLYFKMNLWQSLIVLLGSFGLMLVGLILGARQILRLKYWRRQGDFS